MFEPTEKEIIIFPTDSEMNQSESKSDFYRPKSRKIHFIVPNQSYSRTKLKYRRITHKKSPYYRWFQPAPPELWMQKESDELTRCLRIKFRLYAHYLRRTTYQIEPVEIPYISVTGRRMKYKPLALITFPNEYPTATMKPVLIDVRSKEDIKENWHWYYPAWRAATRFARLSGWNFCLVRDGFFKTPVFTNASFLLDFRNHPQNGDYFTRLTEEMRFLKLTTVHQLLEIVSCDEVEYQAMMPQLWNLIDGNYFGFNLYQPLTVNSEIYRNW